MEKQVIVGLSFGYRNSGEEFLGCAERQPGLSNEALAKIVDNKQAANSSLSAILQCEIAKCVKKEPRFAISEHRIPGQYLDSGEVVSQAADFLRRHEMADYTILLVAHPFLHRFQCKRLFMREGLRVKIVKTGRIPFDKQSAQWWTRGPMKLLIYAFLQAATGRKGH